MRRAIVMLAAVLAVVSTFLVSACGGTPASPGTEHYSNALYNFVFDYKAPLMPLKITPQPSAYRLMYAVTEKTTQADLDRGLGNWLLVGVMSGRGSEDPRLFGIVWLRDMAKQGRALDSFTLLASKQTTLGQQPAFLYEGTGTRAGQRLHFRNVLVVTPRYDYVLNAQTAANVWNGPVGRQIQQSLSSFRLLLTPQTAAHTSPPGSTTLYHNGEFRFTVRYPASFAEAGKDLLPVPTGFLGSFGVGFLDTGAAALAAQSGALDGVLVQAARLPHALTAGQADSFLRLMRATLMTKLTSQYESAYPGAVVSPFRMGYFIDRRCVVSDVTFPYQGGSEFERTYVFVEGAFLYSVELASPQADWNANRKALEHIAHTFRTF